MNAKQKVLSYFKEFPDVDLRADDMAADLEMDERLMKKAIYNLRYKDPALKAQIQTVHPNSYRYISNATSQGVVKSVASHQQPVTEEKTVTKAQLLREERPKWAITVTPGGRVILEGPDGKLYEAIRLESVEN